MIALVIDVKGVYSGCVNVSGERPHMSTHSASVRKAEVEHGTPARHIPPLADHEDVIVRSGDPVVARADAALNGSPGVLQLLRLGSALNAGPSAPPRTPVVQRMVIINGEDGSPLPSAEVMEAAIKIALSEVPAFVKLVEKHGAEIVDTAISDMVRNETPYGSFRLKPGGGFVGIGQTIKFIGKLDSLLPQAVLAPLEVGNVVRSATGVLGVVLVVEPTRALVQDIRRETSSVESREYADDDPEWTSRDTLTVSIAPVNLVPAKARPPRTYGIEKPVESQTTVMEPSVAPRVVAKDLSVRPSVFHMNWTTDPTDRTTGATYIEQMALVGLREGFKVAATVPEDSLEKFQSLVAPEAFQNIQVIPVKAALDTWAEDSGDFQSDGSIHVPRPIPGHLAEKYKPLTSIQDARERRGFYVDESDKAEGNLSRIGASVSQYDYQKDKVALAKELGRGIVTNKSHIEGGNILTGKTHTGQSYALVGRDGVEATRALLFMDAHDEDATITDEQVKTVIGADYGIDPALVFFVEQPGEFHLDMAMVVMGPGQVILNDSRSVFEIEKKIVTEEFKKTEPTFMTGGEYLEWSESLEQALQPLKQHAQRMTPYEERAAQDLAQSGLKVSRVAGVFPGSKFLPAMNFLNGEGGIGKDNQPFFITNGGDERVERYVAEQYLDVLDTGLARVHFLDPKASSKSIAGSGGLGCRAKGECTTQFVAAGAVLQRARGRHKEFKNERQRLATEKRMDDGVFERGHVQQTEDETYAAEFASYLREGSSLILGEDLGGTGDGAQFGSFWDLYDKKYWQLVVTPPSSKKEDKSDDDEEDEPERKLILKEGADPAAAIDFLFAHLKRWAFDCADAVQVATWYAMRHAMGAEAFNESVADMEFALKSHGSTGINSIGTYVRTDEDDTYSPTGTLKFKPDGESESGVVTVSAESIVRKAPIGTRVMLTVDDDDAAGTDFENENMVKIGDNLFAAHPLGIGGFSKIIRLVAMTALDLDEQDEITPEIGEKIKAMSQRIYISEIELYHNR